MPMIRIVCWDISGLDRETYERLYAQSTPERRARADRYRRHEDAVRCIAAEALVRRAAGGSVTVVKDEGGKPRLAGREDFHYNLSHSGRWVVIAWGGSSVGVDVEKMDMDAGKEQIARRFFSREEQDDIFAAEGDLRSERFFQVWTGKESYLKYLGTGLRTPMDAFSVLSLEGVILRRWRLPGGYFLSLCSGEAEATLEIITEL